MIDRFLSKFKIKNEKSSKKKREKIKFTDLSNS